MGHTDNHGRSLCNLAHLLVFLHNLLYSGLGRYNKSSPCHQISPIAIENEHIAIVRIYTYLDQQVRTYHWELRRLHSAPSTRLRMCLVYFGLAV